MMTSSRKVFFRIFSTFFFLFYSFVMRFFFFLLVISPFPKDKVSYFFDLWRITLNNNIKLGSNHTVSTVIIVGKA